MNVNVKRIIKQVIKKQHEKGVYSETFNEEINEIIGNQMDKIAKIATEDDEVERYLLDEAEDCIRAFLINNDINVN